MPDFVHVFLGRFLTREAALQYTQEQWQPQPDDSASDDEWTLWEESNPTWQLEEHLGCGLDSDFIETIDIGQPPSNSPNSGFSYLESFLTQPAAINQIAASLPDATQIVLIFEQAFHVPPSKLQSTSLLTYCGRYEITWRK